MDLIYESLLRERQIAKNRIKQLEEKLKKAPRGYLRIDKTADSFRYYRRLPQKDTKKESPEEIKKTAKRRTKYGYKYIPLKEKDLAERLSEKTYYTRMLHMYKARLRSIEQFLKSCPSSDELDIYMKLHEGCRCLIREGLTPMPEAARKWAEEPYERSRERPENLVQPAPGNRMVRSKSEAMIISRLEHFGLPLRYECLLWVNGKRFYPDFMIMDPRTGEIIIWEHFGMMDAEEYRNIWLYKMEQYKLAGYIPGINLITTYESKSHPLSQAFIDSVISAFFGK